MLRGRKSVNKGENCDVELLPEVLRDQIHAGAFALRPSEEVMGSRLSDSLLESPAAPRAWGHSLCSLHAGSEVGSRRRFPPCRKATKEAVSWDPSWPFRSGWVGADLAQ